MNSVNDEVMRFIAEKNKWYSADINILIARGKIPDYSTLNLYGYQPAIGTDFLPVWENATAYTYPVSAITMYLAGSNGDTASVLISGLSSTYAPISETVTLNGVTPVATTNTYLRINNMQVSLGNPSGVVTLKNLAGTAIYAQINAGIGRNQAGIYTVPAGYTYYLQRINVYTSLNGNNFATYQNRTVSSTGVVQVTQQAPFAESYLATRIMPRPFLEKTDIQLQCKLQANTGAVGVAQEGYLIKNSVD
jgi:hypothetical protein